MKLLVVRTGINWEEENIPAFKNCLKELFPNLAIIVLHGENNDIETSFQIVDLY